MDIIKGIIIGCWLVFLLFWLILSRDTKRAEVKREVGGFWWNLAGRVFFVLLFMEGFGIIFPIPILATRILPAWASLGIMSAILVIIGFAIAIASRISLGGNWSGDVELKKGHELITTGMYGVVRHPIYTGILLMSFGSLIFASNIVSLIFFMIMLSFLLYKLRKEEELLLEHFPKEYPEYVKKTKALIPFIF